MKLCSKLCKIKQRSGPEEIKNGVYSIEHKMCGTHYVGRIGQHFCERRKQHKRDGRNKKSSDGIFNHLRNNKGDSVNWAKLKIWNNIKTGKAGKLRRQLYNVLHPSSRMNPKKVMNLEKSFV